MMMMMMTTTTTMMMMKTILLEKDFPQGYFLIPFNHNSHSNILC